MDLERTQCYVGVDNLDVMEVATKYNAAIAARIQRAAEGCRSMLDFGAGTGTFARLLSLKGAHVRCVEPDAGLRDLLVRRGFEAMSSLQEYGPGAVAFVYSINVLEHIEDDARAARELFEVLQQGGRLFVYVPALEWLYSAMDRKVGHFRRYRRDTLLEVLRLVGFEVLASGYCDVLGLAASLGYRLMGDRRGNISEASVSLYDRWVFPISDSFDRLIDGALGKNLWAVARRPFRERSSVAMRATEAP